MIGLCGCSAQVRVIDEAGNPIARAQVRPVTLSITGAPRETDRDGHVSIPDSVSIQDVKWVNVERDGYVPVQVPIGNTSPLVITLKKAD